MAPHADTGVGYMDGYSMNSNATSNAPKELFTVESPNVTYTPSEIRSKYVYHTTTVTKSLSGQYVASQKRRSTTSRWTERWARRE